MRDPSSPGPHHRSLQLLPERLPPSFLATSDHENPGCLQPPRSCCITSHRRWSSCAGSARESRPWEHGKRAAVCGRYFQQYTLIFSQMKRPADLQVPSPFHHIHRSGLAASCRPDAERRGLVWQVRAVWQVWARCKRRAGHRQFPACTRPGQHPPRSTSLRGDSLRTR
jgi:hypothetical protein